MSDVKKLTGLFLGAGASYEAGMPLLWELTGEIRNWLTPAKLRELNAGWRLQGTGFADQVINDLASMLDNSAIHYEAMLGYLELQYRRQRLLPQDYHGLYSWLVELVYQLLYYRQINNKLFLDRHLPYYDGIRALAEANAPLWIFSLNHDVIVEAIAARLSIPLHTGFSKVIVRLPRRDPSGQKKGEIIAEVLTKQELERNAMYFPNPLQPGIYLLKVHGALDMFTFNDGQDMLKLLPTSSGEAGVIDVLRVANEELFYILPGAPGGRAKATNEIAYADDQGVMQFLRRSLLAGAFKFDSRGNQVLPKSMLKHFRENLNFVTNLVCIGYGFGDLHVNTVLREWLELSRERRLEIVAPNVKEIPAFLLHLLPQITLTDSTATDYFDRQAGIIRSPREQKEKRVAAILRAKGKERASEAMSSFFKKDGERITREFLAKLAALPSRDGQPDIGAIGDPAELARRWASELKLDNEGLLDRLLGDLQADKA
jgi:hypothetical protein